ncbi:MAG: Flp family type IVb pilin [Actinomycetota bacterium]|nr:Flp family type IVb pilin [Actinomycetota bacterium]
MLNMITKLQLLTQRDRGQTMAEYAVVLAVITIGIFVALGLLSGAISGALSTISAQL